MLVNGVGSAFLVVSSEPQEAWPAFPSDERKQWGASREHRNIMASLPKMLQEAWYSLWCGFSYSSKENVGEIQFYLCKNMKEELSLGKLAERFHFSEAYFCALFKKGTGMSVIHFIQYVRIHYGAYLIRNERKKLQEVSEQVGFENYSYFGKLFKKYIGQTPETYRGGVAGEFGDIEGNGGVVLLFRLQRELEPLAIEKAEPVQHIVQTDVAVLERISFLPGQC